MSTPSAAPGSGFPLGPLNQGEVIGVGVGICAVALLCLVILAVVWTRRTRRRDAAGGYDNGHRAIALRELGHEDQNKPPAPAYGDFDSSVMVQEGPPPDYEERELAALRREQARAIGEAPQASSVDVSNDSARDEGLLRTEASEHVVSQDESPSAGARADQDETGRVPSHAQTSNIHEDSR